MTRRVLTAIAVALLAVVATKEAVNWASAQVVGAGIRRAS